LFAEEVEIKGSGQQKKMKSLSKPCARYLLILDIRLKEGASRTVTLKAFRAFLRKSYLAMVLKRALMLILG